MYILITFLLLFNKAIIDSRHCLRHHILMNSTNHCSNYTSIGQGQEWGKLISSKLPNFCLLFLWYEWWDAGVVMCLGQGTDLHSPADATANHYLLLQ